jgi:hypothetical protein
VTITGLWKRTKKGNTMKKLSQKLTSLLVRARTADTSSTQAIRREFNTGELVTIRDTPWAHYSLNEDDLNKLKQIKHLVGQVLKERQRKKQGKKARAVRRLKHHEQQPDILETADSNEEISDDELSTVDDNQLQCSEQVLEAEDESIAQAA